MPDDPMPTACPVVPKLWPGELVVCVASGPSLTAEDVARVRGKARVIAVNDGVRLAPWADVLYSSDRRWWRHHRGCPSFQGLKYGIGSALKHYNPIHEHRDVQVLQNTGVSHLELEPSGLRTGNNSGYAAVNLAVHLGAKQIALLGYDMGAPKRGHTHFFGEHPPVLRIYTPWEMFRKRFLTIIAPLEQAGVDLVNCSRETALRGIRRASLESVLASCEVAA